MTSANPPHDTLREDETLVAPQRPHDDFSFDELANAYNFKVTSDRRLIFARLLIKECKALQHPVRVLDIGCGRGIGRRMDYLHAISKHVDDFWGLEPDEGVQPDDGIFNHFQHALMETAKLPDDHFDLAYSFMVMEHVADPDAFMKAVCRTLKPGGTFIFMTPNGNHYFTRIASLAHRLKLDEFILKFLKRSEAEDYHYPVQYKFNKVSQVKACLQKTGFDRGQYAYMESKGPASYLPGPLRPILWIMNLKRRVIRQDDCLLTLIGRTERKA